MIRSVRRLASAVRSAGFRLARPRMYQSARELWSQEGEDLILAQIHGAENNGLLC